MSGQFDETSVRLRVITRNGEQPHWLGSLLLALDQLAGVELQLRCIAVAADEPAISPISRLWRSHIPALAGWNPDSAAKHCLSRWKTSANSTCDVVLILDAALCQSIDEPAATQWLVTDSHGQALAHDFPLLQGVSTGVGLQLQLCQRDSATNSLHSIRQLHLPASSRYGKALELLPDAVLQLVRQALVDRRLAVSLSSVCHALDAPGPGFSASSSGSPWQQGVGGFFHALWQRIQAKFLSEYWCVGVIDRPIGALLAADALPDIHWLSSGDAAGAGYWADPFGMPGDPERLVCEFFNERTGIGHLEVLKIGTNRTVVERKPLTVGNGAHVSFPHVFEFEGRRLGVAEMIASRQCMLHELDDAGVWLPLLPLLDDVAAADPALVFREGRWWLAFTDNDQGKHDNLCFYYADRLEGPWTPHANNPVKLDITGARMAGGFFCHDGELYRPAQNCHQTYGASIVVHKIVNLTPTSFEEIPVRRIFPGKDGICRHGLHTLNAWGEKTLIDGKRHGVNLTALWRNLSQRLGGRRQVSPSQKCIPEGQNRLLVYIPHLRVGGGEISMLRLAEGMAGAGLHVDLVIHSQATSELPVPPGISLHCLDCEGTLAALFGLVRLLRARRPEWVLSAFPHTNIALITAMTLSGLDARCVITEHAPLSRQILQQSSWRYRILPPLVRWAYRRAQAVVAVSSGVRDDLRDLLGSKANLQVINNPVLASNFEAEMARPPEDAWLADDSLQVVLSVCRLSVEKDLPTLVQAFYEIHREHPRARLILAGEGPERGRLESLIREKGLADVVRLPGYTSAPLAWMRHAAVFVLASQYEGFGNALVEAMACGTPVVSTDCPVGPREILEGGRYGALVPVGDVAAMADAISRVLAQRTQPAGARDAALRYTQANACASYLRLFEGLSEGIARC